MPGICAGAAVGRTFEGAAGRGDAASGGSGGSVLSVGEGAEGGVRAGRKGKIRLDAKTAKCVRGMAGNVTEKREMETLGDGIWKKGSDGKSIKLSADVYERYFAGVKPADVAGIVEEALSAWFGKGGMADVPGGRDTAAG